MYHGHEAETTDALEWCYILLILRKPNSNVHVSIFEAVLLYIDTQYLICCWMKDGDDHWKRRRREEEEGPQRKLEEEEEVYWWSSGPQRRSHCQW